MPAQTPSIGGHVIIPKPALQQVFDALKGAGYTLVGPTVDESAIVYGGISSVSDLPIGWTDTQEPGSYRLRRRPDQMYFGFASSPHSWKKFLYPAAAKLFSARRSDGEIEFTPGDGPAPRYALIGVRACDLAAIGVHDRVFLEGRPQDSFYGDRRQAAFVLAVNCIEPGGVCFCASVKTGPRCGGGYDLAMTEMEAAFLLEIGSELGAHVLAGVEWRPAGAYELSRARRAVADAEGRMGRAIDTHGLPDLMYDNLEHHRWSEVAHRCLSCANCTMVCPTCFCSDVEDVSDLTGAETSRVRVWDSCFNREFSYVFGGHLRPNVRARYRQWLTHKLAAWIDQYGVLGCVGCGRCITWCPVGIDLTEELAAIRGESKP